MTSFSNGINIDLQARPEVFIAALKLRARAVGTLVLDTLQDPEQLLRALRRLQELAERYGVRLRFSRPSLEELLVDVGLGALFGAGLGALEGGPVGALLGALIGGAAGCAVSWVELRFNERTGTVEIVAD
jgi:hypothetical protein